MATNNSKNQPTAVSGKVLQGQGIGTASNFSTATYPATATGTGKILRADGTNWVASTATYPDTAGSSTNVLTSDGTNWSSSAAAGGSLYNGFITTNSGSPADSTTYYLVSFQAFTGFTLGGYTPMARFYVTNTFTLNKIYANFNVAGTLASNENCTFFVRKNNTTTTNISTTLQLTSVNNTVTTSSLGVSLAAGDYFNFGFTSPAWGTNPTVVSAFLAWSS